jgi:hypothetical protein
LHLTAAQRPSVQVNPVGQGPWQCLSAPQPSLKVSQLPVQVPLGWQQAVLPLLQPSEQVVVETWPLTHVCAIALEPVPLQVASDGAQVAHWALTQPFTPQAEPLICHCPATQVTTFLFCASHLSGKLAEPATHTLH